MSGETSKKTYIFYADKGFAPPPLNGHVRYECKFFLDDNISSINTSFVYT